MSEIDNKLALTNNTINKIMQASLGEVNNKMRVSFKKTVLVRDYETEVIEATTDIELDHEISGAERIFVSAILRAQMEYEAYCNLVMKGMIVQRDFDERKEALANEVNAVKAKSEIILGKSLDKYFELKV